MARNAGALNAKRIAKLRPGAYKDPESRGLYLQISPTATKSWLLKYELNGRVRYMGLGAYPDFSLKEARERARAARQKIADGIDPIDAKRAERTARALEAAKVITFEAAARVYYKQHEPKWKNRKAAAQFFSTLEDYVFPIFGKLAVADVDTGLVLKALERDHPRHPGKSLWMAVPVTANRVRGRIEAVLDWATVRKHRTGDNPARWKGHLDNVLPAPGQIQKVNHHSALAYAEVPAFMAALAEREGVAARALEFTVLTAARTSETIGAVWSEIDLEAKTWTIPAERMKGGRPHRVPLSDRAVEILEALPHERHNDHVFIGARADGLSNMAMASVLKRMGRNGITVHGFRSSLMDWAHEQTATPKVVIDMALAHIVSDKVEAAYRRGDLFAKRTRLMRDWAKYCMSPAPASGANVTPIHEGRSRA